MNVNRPELEVPEHRLKKIEETAQATAGEIVSMAQELLRLRAQTKG